MECKNNYNIRDIIKVFIPILLAVVLQYAVSIIDLICIFIKNLFSEKKTTSDFTVENIISMDYNQPMNLALVNTLKFLLYIIIFGYWYYKVFIKDGPKDVPLKENIKSSMTPLLAVFLALSGVVGQFLIDGFLNIFRHFFTDAFASYDSMINSVTGASASWLMYLAVFILAPIGEELLFRGLLYNLSKKILLFPLAIVFQAFMFGAYHGNLIQGIYAFAMGLVLGFIAYKFDSIIPCIFIHIIINTSVIFVPGALFDSITLCIITTIVSFALFVLFLTLAMKQKNKHASEEAQ